MQRSLVCLVTALCLLACQIQAEEPGVSTRSTVSRLRLPGTVAAGKVEICVPADGTVESIMVKEGQVVRRGDILFKLDDRHQQAAYEVAQAQLESAHASLEAARVAMEENKSNSSLVTNVRKAEAAVKVAEAQVNGCKLDLQEKVLLSPMDGAVTDYTVQPGQFARKGTALTTVLQTETTKVVCEISVSLLHDISPGQEVQIFAGHDRDDPPFIGKIDYVAPQVKASTASVVVKAVVASHGKLLDGMPVTVEISRQP